MYSRRFIRLAVLTGTLGGLVGGPAALLAQARGDDAPPATTTVRRTYDLPKPKADALLDLLAPNDVRVLVGRTDDGVFIEGTPDEAAVIDGLTELITRYKDRKIDDADGFIDELRPTWTTHETYKLPDAKAAVLFRILAMDDVPVLVARGNGQVSVDASDADQKIIRGVVGIIAGSKSAGSRDMDDGRGPRRRAHRGDESAARRHFGRRRPEKPGRPQRPGRRMGRRPPHPPHPPHPPAWMHDDDNDHMGGAEARMHHMRMSHEVFEQIAELRAQRRELESQAMQLRHEMEELNEAMDRLAMRLDEIEAHMHAAMDDDDHAHAHADDDR